MKSALFFVGATAILSASCGGCNETPKEPAPVETVVVTDTVTLIEAVDTAAIIAHYEALHAPNASKKSPSAHKAHSVKKDKQVAVISHPTIEHHDVIRNPAPPSNPSSTASSSTPDPVVIVLHDKETVYFRPDEKASFPGGEKAFDKFLLENLEYPEEALNAGVEGTVYSVVYLDEQGNISKVEFPDGRIGYGLNREAERILRASPRWNPAKHEGVPVKSKFSIPITFDIK